jgi:hypothetical protein
VSSESSRLAQQQLRVPATPVRAQLDRILASETFSRSERLSDFLRYVVEETLRGDGGGLKETVIGRELYRRGADFDAATDPIVRVDARRLRDKLREYYSESTNDPILITLPKGSYVPVFERNPTSVPLVHPFPKPELAAALEPVRPAALRRTGWWFAAALVCTGAGTPDPAHDTPRKRRPTFTVSGRKLRRVHVERQCRRERVGYLRQSCG